MQPLSTLPARLGRYLVLLQVCGACAGSKAQPTQNVPQSESNQSVAEYDIATDLWLNRSRPRQALSHALHAAELDDENADAAHLIALLYLDFCRQDLKECRLAEAESQVKRALDERPELREAINTLGVIHIHQKKYQEAVNILHPLTQDILYQTPENAWGNLGWAYLEQGKLEPAIEALLRSTAVQPSFCVGHYRLGLAYEKKNEPRSAMLAYTHALKVDHPRCKTLQVAYAARARVELALGRQDDATTDLDTCVRLAKHTEAGRECMSLIAQTTPRP